MSAKGTKSLETCPRGYTDLSESYNTGCDRLKVVSSNAMPDHSTWTCEVRALDLIDLIESASRLVAGQWTTMEPTAGQNCQTSSSGTIAVLEAGTFSKLFPKSLSRPE